MRRPAHHAALPLLTLIAFTIAFATSHAQRQKPPDAAGRQISEDEVVRVSTTLVTVPVGVKDRRGRPVLKLRREDFRLYEDGVEQEIAYFESPEVPDGDRQRAAEMRLTVALLLDVSDSTQFKLEQIQDAANAFINQLRDGDRVIVVVFDKRVQVLAEATADRGVLREAVSRARSGGGTSLYNALDAVIKHHLGRTSGRKAIVLFTDGVDTASRGATYESTIRAAEELDAVIYPIQYSTYEDFVDDPSRQTNVVGMGGATAHMTRSGELASKAYERGTLFLRLLAEKTGGRFHYAGSPKNLSRSFARVTAELRQHYTLGYYPKKRSTGGERREIDVQVGVPGTTVRARKSYIYQPPGGAAVNQ